MKPVMLIPRAYCVPELRAPGREKYLLFLIENKQKQSPLLHAGEG